MIWTVLLSRCCCLLSNLSLSELLKLHIVIQKGMSSILLSLEQDYLFLHLSLCGEVTWNVWGVKFPILRFSNHLYIGMDKPKKSVFDVLYFADSVQKIY